MSVEILTLDGQTLTGTLSESVTIRAKFGQQVIPAAQIAGIRGGKEPGETAHTIFTLDALFAATGEDREKDGFVKVDQFGGPISSGTPASNILPIKNVTKVEVDFYGAHFAGDEGSGYLKVEFLDQQGKRVGVTQVSIANTINDWRSYTRKDKLQHYQETVAIGGQTIAAVKLFAHPGNWAIVVRELKVNAYQK
jgi:hypothetical protein